ncbi:MAG: hypothetical protein U1A27_02035 [Phycisphaerae bacterium]
MHQHHDEFSVADLRQTFENVWRVAATRHWWFILPTLAAATIACTATHWLPRTYMVSATLERCRDVVLNNLGKGWADAVDAVRSTAGDDLRSPAAWRRAAHAAGIPAGFSVDGMLDGLEVKIVSPEPTRDLLSLTLTGPEPKHYPAIMRTVCDTYIADVERRTTRILQDARQFYTRQSSRSTQALGALEAELAELERCHPGLAPEADHAAREELSTLVRQRHEDTAKLADLADEIAASDRALGDLSAPAANAVAPHLPTTRRIENPQREALISALEKAQVEMWQNRKFKGMTDQHPVVVALAARIDEMQAELARTPEFLAAAPELPGDAPAAQGVAIVGEASRLEHERETLEQRRETLAARLAACEQRANALMAQRADAAKFLEARTALIARVDRAKAEVETWRGHIDPIDRVLTVQAEHRGIRLRVADAPHLPRLPTSPNPRTVLFVCLVLSLATGVAAVFLREVTDGSCRTAAQLASAAGVQVLSVIDLINPAAARARRTSRLLGARSIATIGLALAAAISAAGAYVDLTDPPRFARWVAIGANSVAKSPSVPSAENAGRAA